MRRAVVLLAPAVAVTPALAQLPTTVDRFQPVGCFLASPALTYSAFGNVEGRDTSWAILRLSRDGRARRPLLRGDRDRRSGWARYLTDVIGGEPVLRALVLTRRACQDLPDEGLPPAVLDSRLSG